MDTVKVRSRIECTQHDGAHKGLVVAQLNEEIYGVAWDDMNHDQLFQVKKNFADNHPNDITLTRSSAIRELR